MSLSRLNRSKGIDLLIRAFTFLAKRGQSYKLIIAGQDEAGELKKLKDLAEKLEVSKQVDFVGHLEGSEKEKKPDLETQLQEKEKESKVSFVCQTFNIPNMYE